MNYSRDAIITERLWFPTGNLQVRCLKRVIKTVVCEQFSQPTLKSKLHRQIRKCPPIVTGPLMLSSPFWGSWTGAPHHPRKIQGSSWSLPFILKNTTDLGPVMLRWFFSGYASVCNQPSKSVLAPVWMCIAIMSEVKAVLVLWFMHACYWHLCWLKSTGKTHKFNTVQQLMLQSSQKKTRILQPLQGRHPY